MKATVPCIRQEGARRRELHMIVKLLHGSNPVHKTKIETHLSQLLSKNTSPEMPSTLQLQNSLNICVFKLVDCMPLGTQSRAKI
jgi:hypothetical protein